MRYGIPRRNLAKARTVATPLMFIVPELSSMRLSQEALMTMASLLDVLGEDITA